MRILSILFIFICFSSPLMQLVEQGKITYQDTVVKYLPKTGPWENKVTIKQLMSHTSGLPPIYWIDNIDSADAAFDKPGQSVVRLLFCSNQYNTFEFQISSLKKVYFFITVFL